MEQANSVSAPSSSSAEISSAEYFSQRQLKQGTVGWLLLIGLGVAYVISGDFAGWNFGIAQGGWGGMFVATILVAIMYLCLCLCTSHVFVSRVPGRTLSFWPDEGLANS